MSSQRGQCFQFSFEQRKILAGGQEPKVGSFLSFVGQMLALWSGTLPAGQLITGHHNSSEPALGKWRHCIVGSGFYPLISGIKDHVLAAPAFLPFPFPLSLSFLIFYIIFLNFFFQVY